MAERKRAILSTVPEEELLLTWLRWAIEDYLGQGRVATAREREIYCRDAAAWFHDSHDGCGTFIWLCRKLRSPALYLKKRCCSPSSILTL